MSRFKFQLIIIVKKLFHKETEYDWMIFNQVIFLAWLKFDPIFDDFSIFLLNKMFHQNKNLKYEKLLSRTFSLQQNFQKCLHWIARIELCRWWVTPIFRSESNHANIQGSSVLTVLKFFFLCSVSNSSTWY